VSGVAHWDEVEGFRPRPPFDGLWADLGSAAGSVAVGLKRARLGDGVRSTPAHVHGAEEEIFYVLAGDGTSWQDGRSYDVREGDCLVHLPDREAHTLVAGAGGLDVLAFGQRLPPEIAYLPRAGVAWLGPTFGPVGGTHPYDAEAAVGELELPSPSPRPDGIVNAADVPLEQVHEGRAQFSERRLSGMRSLRTGLRLVTVAAGCEGHPPHCHSAQEELFVVLGGAGVLVLADRDEHPVSRGSVVARPAGTRVAHSFRAADEPLTYLAYGTRESWDATWYPRSGTISFPGLGVSGRLHA
jgi:uncharacterized cupin superfamily protein